MATSRLIPILPPLLGAWGNQGAPLNSLSAEVRAPPDKLRGMRRRISETRPVVAPDQKEHPAVAIFAPSKSSDLDGRRPFLSEVSNSIRFASRLKARIPLFADAQGSVENTSLGDSETQEAGSLRAKNCMWGYKSPISMAPACSRGMRQYLLLARMYASWGGEGVSDTLFGVFRNAIACWPFEKSTARSRRLPAPVRGRSLKCAAMAPMYCGV